MDGAEALAIEDESAALFDAIRAELLDEYRQPHPYPWIIGYSGGKDSTLVAHLVFEMLMALPPSERKRQVHIVANDTLVESPLVVQHIIDSITEIEKRGSGVRPAGRHQDHAACARSVVLGEPDRARLPLAEPLVPLVHRSDENPAHQPLHQELR
jgi:3'-phosphoadenosine 5'-phosphosulfate sulfotransferase (PAPS reductase)/FAD synthetase